MLNDYEIRNKLRYMIINNVDFNDIFIKIIINILREEEMLYDFLQRRFRYNDYIINLTIQVFLFKKTINDYEYLKNLTLFPFDAQLN